ncbi:MAG: hypothetical protein A2381_04280 [Bdellovibrionales bacterium RIFOXYB1_FULL_37_110]|nr:MAG: hypothetical protein A2181_09505 [Bdellovibrionales bacterium RIFOXYA1_FULL_38_20]OFZ46608.1 MAG: hypothetical protein A2417_04565 [Bdellovibrionales bacterium RIFOXYC1_FULL_37_79]OFZ57462.1 MAG: hypothetical protein A2381_04280 [Bdellovibrionales bacterium RIFOXYB1_FULL_37_110]OFZ64547.1 MAG: hypothetical protein A2577_13755 [Bdellovibrionales bacterium RIFOXYD1_FULL_36_51]
MFDKNVDLLIVGKNYLSLLMGIENVLKKRNVLLLDDDRYKLGDDYLNGINEFEKLFLEEWIDQKGIGELVDLSKYLKHQDNIFLLGNKRLRLGRDYWSNLYEMVRKLDFNWELKNDLEGALNLSFKTEFNELMGFYLKDQAHRLVDLKISADFLYEQFLTTAPEIIKHLFKVTKGGLLSNLNKPTIRDQYIQALLFASRGFYQYDTDSNIGDAEFFHLFISMLAPYYQIDHEKLILDLLNLYQKQNGIFKKTSICDWSFDKFRPWALELSSYEGIVHPRKTALFFGKLNDPCFKLEPEGPLYSSIGIRCTLNNSTFEPMSNTKYIICSDTMIGTNRPFWWLKISDNQLLAKCFIDFQKATKLSFIREELEQFFASEIKIYFPDLADQIIAKDISFDHDICMVAQTRHNEIELRPRLVYQPKGQITHPTRDMFYLGPYNKKAAGLISTLMELNHISLDVTAL